MIVDLEFRQNQDGYVNKKLNSIAKIVAGQSPPSSTYNTAGDGMPFFQGKADFKEKYPQVRMWCNSENRKEAEPGDILISVRAPVGSVNICNQKSIIGRGLSAIRPFPNLNGEFLYYFFKSNEQKIANLGTGSTFKAITQETLGKIDVPLPPITDQIRIAHLFGKVEGLMAQRKQHLQQLDDLLKSVFLEMFGDPVQNDKGWNILSLGSISDVQGGLQVTTKRDSYSLRMPYLRVANVYRNRLDLNEVKQIGLTPEELERVRLRKDDLLIVEGHGNPEEIGRSAVWDGSIENCVHQNHLIRVRVNSQIITALYSSFFINSSGGRNQMLKAGKTTSGLNTISTKNVKETKVTVPPIDLQNQFAIIVEKVEDLKSCYQQSLSELENLYGVLSQKAFKGELDLSRVGLPVDLAEIAEETESATSVTAETKPKPTIELPAPDDLKSLTTTEGWKAMIEQWLTIYIERLKDSKFSVEQFMEIAQQRLRELQEDEPIEPGFAEYNHVKDLVFRALESGRLTQSYEGNWVRIFSKRP